MRDFPSYFADAEASFEEAEFVVFGAPYDQTCSFRFGTRYAPKEIRKAAWNIETYNIRTGLDIKNRKIHDLGDLDISANSPTEAVEEVRKAAEKIVSAGKFPIMMGGEHSMTPGVIAGFGKKAKDLFIVSIDAHIDYRLEYDDEKNNHACAMRRCSEFVGPKNIAVLGIRSGCLEEMEDAKRDNLFYRDSYWIRENGIENAIAEALKRAGKRKIYFTLDIDGIDPAYAPGTGTPEAFGLHDYDVLKIIDAIAPRLVGFDVMEVCPPYDNGNTSMLAAKIVREVISKVKG
jgi:agmatinase